MLACFVNLIFIFLSRNPCLGYYAHTNAIIYNKLERIVVNTITKSVIKLVCLFSIFVGSASVAEDLVLDSPSVRVHIDQGSGSIHKLEVASGVGDSPLMSPILQGGELIRLEGIGGDTTGTHEIAATADGQGAAVSTFELGSGLTLVRRIRPGSAPYTLLCDFVFENQTDRPLDLELPSLKFALGYTGVLDPRGGYGSSVYAYRHLFLSRPGEATRLDMAEAARQSLDAGMEWIGWVNRYQVLAIRPLGGEDSESTDARARFSVVESGGEVASPENTSFSLDLARVLQPGESQRLQFEVVAAPKNREILADIQPTMEGLVLMNLWDWFRWVCFAFSQLIHFLFSLTNNWGVTLILVALVVRIITIPVTRSSLRYQERAIEQQTKMKPLVQSLNETYKGVELSQHMVELYQREKFDHLLPFKGMIGLFIQIPIFIALFNVLAETPELSGASFLWIGDLALSDRLFSLGVNIPFFGGYFNLLPFVMAFVTVLSTWYASKKSSEQKMQFGALFGMAGAFFVLFYSFPAALVLYWTFSNLFQFIQQILESLIENNQEQE
jgi:YidC/Oxa1 family membrane protein insertase